jgi:thymidylate kinase
LRGERYIAIEGADGVGKSTMARKLVAFLNEHLAPGLCRSGFYATAEPNAILHTQPTTGRIGALIRETLRSPKPIDDTSLQLLFAADRIDASHEIRSILGAGHHVISDRCELSSAVYYAASQPRFLCLECKVAMEEQNAIVRKGVKRWNYDENYQQQQFLTLDTWGHEGKCHSDLKDVARHRFDEALSWNERAVHPSLIIVIVVDRGVAEERMRKRGSTSDMMELDVIQRRAHAIYNMVSERMKLRPGSKIVKVDGSGSEEEVWWRIVDHVSVHLIEVGESDRYALHQRNADPARYEFIPSLRNAFRFPTS